MEYSACQPANGSSAIPIVDSTEFLEPMASLKLPLFKGGNHPVLDALLPDLGDCGMVVLAVDLVSRCHETVVQRRVFAELLQVTMHIVPRTSHEMIDPRATNLRVSRIDTRDERNARRPGIGHLPRGTIIPGSIIKVSDSDQDIDLGQIMAALFGDANKTEPDG